METIGKCTRLAAILVGIAALVLAGLVVQAGAQVADLTVCNGVEVCDPALTEVCKAGFEVKLTGFQAANNQNSGSATYTYQICVPPLGVCTSTVRPGEGCKDNNFCKKKGLDEDPTATCNRTCAVDDFKALSNFDVTFPDFGTCVSQHNEITGTCSVGTFGLGDASCFIKTCGGVRGGTQCANNTECAGNPDGETCNAAGAFVAKCDGQSAANPGDCLTMTVTIAGETTDLGLGAAVVADKEGQTCASACIQGPSCTPCEPPGDGEACLTRTIGFWGTHPWITNNYDPVTVCGRTLDCSGSPDGKSNPACLAGSCTSIMEGLGSIPSELKSNEAYVSLVKQLTAAKLNLNATDALTNGQGQCSSFIHEGIPIQQWISTCEALCGANKATISNSGCIQALDAFNNSQDTGFGQTPAPFDRPSVDDFNNISGADPTQFNLAQGKKTPPGKLVIGKNVGANLCQ